jgi:hypothetical protein
MPAPYRALAPFRSCLSVPCSGSPKKTLLGMKHSELALSSSLIHSWVGEAP